jgi:hypothetical protein
MTTTASAMPYTNLGEALATDYLLVREQFSKTEWDRFPEARRFVDQEPLATGLVHIELHRGDGSLGTFLGVQAGGSAARLAREVGTLTVSPKATSRTEMALYGPEIALA